jgi:hypothetical protein
MQELWLCFWFAACYEAHLPSVVTVRDENAGNALQATCGLSHSSQTNGVAGVDDDDAMHRDVCRQSEHGTQARDHLACGHMPHLETKHVRKKRLFQGTHASAAQCCSVLFQGMMHPARQLTGKPPLEVT